MMPAPKAESPAVDLAEAARFLDLMAEGEPVTFQTFADRDKSSKLARILHGDLDQHGSELVRLNAAGAGIFYMPNFGDGKGRTTDNVTGVRALFVDLDGAPLAPVLSCGLDPHVIVESSPGRFHSYWMVADCQLDAFERWQKALAARFDGDPVVHDLPRVMRVPGFIHRKGEPFRSRIVQTAAVQPYPLVEVVERLNLAAAGQDQARARDRTAGKARAPAAGAPAPQAFLEGQRNAGLTRLAGAMRRKGMSPEAIEAALLAENLARCRPALSDDEVRAIAASVSRYAPDPKAAHLVVLPTGPGADAWPDPILPGSIRTPDIPATLLPSWCAEMAAAVAAAVQVPEALPVMTILGVLGVCLQGRFEVAPYGDEYREPLSIWPVTALPPGARKTAVHTEIVEPLQRWEKNTGDRMRPEIARVYAAREVATKRMEKLKADAAKEDDVDRRGRIQDEIQRERENMPAELRAPKLFTTNATPERTAGLLAEHGGRMSIVSDETDTFLIMAGHYSGGTASLDMYLQGFAGSTMRVDRQGTALHIDNPTLSICLAVQPEAFGELASSKRLRVTGLLARFLYAIPKSNIGARDVRARKTVPNAVRDTYRGRILDLLDGYLMRGDGPRVLTFEDDALEAWLAFSEGVEASQGEGGRYEAISDWTGKLPGQAARMAALFQIADVGLMADRVTLVNVQRALDLSRLLVRHAEAAFALLGADDADADALAVLRWIQAGRFQQFTRREAQRAMHGRFTKVERLERALSILFDRYLISGERKAMTGGRASAFYLVNPKLYPERRPT